jgi:hypothetical protein
LRRENGLSSLSARSVGHRRTRPDRLCRRGWALTRSGDAPGSPRFGTAGKPGS